MHKNIIFLFLLLFLIKNTWAQQMKFSANAQQVAEDAAWCWFSDPRAVYHKGDHERIYYGYINSKGDVMIGARNQKTGQTKTFNLHPELQVDDHNVPSILFLPDGKLLVFYTHHNGKFFMRKSKNAEDISEWEEERILSFGPGEKVICYSNPAMLSEENNRIYMFYRCLYVTEKKSSFRDWYQMMSYSDDFGETWSDGQRVMDSYDIDNPVYMKVSSDDKSRIDILFTDGHPKIGAASVYHMYYENGQFHQTDGQSIAPVSAMPIGIDKVNKVYDVTVHKTKSWIWDIALDENRSPVVTYARYPHETEHRYHYARWDGQQWQDEELCVAGPYITRLRPDAKLLEGHYSGGIVLDHNNTDHVYLAREVSGRFEIEFWRREEDKWSATEITKQSQQDNVRPYVVKYSPEEKPSVLWMQGTYHHYTDFKTALMMRE